MARIPCPTCQCEIPESVKSCPHCSHTISHGGKRAGRDSLFWRKIALILLVLIVAGIWIISGQQNQANPVSIAEGELRTSSSTDPSSYSSSVSSTDKGNAWYVATEAVKDSLKAPSTAKFCNMSDATITRSGIKYTVSGYVDAQNSFGAILRNDFIVTFNMDSQKATNIDVSIF